MLVKGYDDENDEVTIYEGLNVARTEDCGLHYRLVNVGKKTG